MKKNLLKLCHTGLFLAIGLFGTLTQAGVKIGDNPTILGTSSLLELESVDQALVLSRLANTAAVTTPVNGMVIYDLAAQCIKGYEKGDWGCLASNLYTSDGVLGSNRVVAQGDKTLAFTATAVNAFSVDSTTLSIDAANNAVGIGTDAPDTSSVLDIVSATKGVAFPTVALTSNTLDIDGVSGQKIGLIVFNSGTAQVTQGFHYWNGSEWRIFESNASVAPQISSLECSSTLLEPKYYQAGVPYIGILKVLYTGGNGGSIATDNVSINSTGVTGLKAILKSGKLDSGNGYLAYDVSGTPSQSSPNTASFALPAKFGAPTGCNAVVGAPSFGIGETKSSRVVLTSAGFMANGGSRLKMNNASGSTITVSERAASELVTPTVLNNFIVINGLRMDFLESAIDGNVYPTLYNTTTTDIVYSLSALSTNDQFIDSNNSIIKPNAHSFKIDGDNNFSTGSGTGSSSEYVNAMITFPNGQWYNLTYYANRDGTNHYFYFTAQRLN